MYSVITRQSKDTLVLYTLLLLSLFQTEAVHGIHSLLVSSFEEGLLDTYTCCYQGLFLPRSSGTVPSDNSQPEMDDEVVKRDVVRGYLQMTLLPRLRYILEMCQPPLELATMIMDIIIVIARHSPYAANKVEWSTIVCCILQ